jgi:hypothetical protein
MNSEPAFSKSCAHGKDKLYFARQDFDGPIFQTRHDAEDWAIEAIE